MHLRIITLVVTILFSTSCVTTEPNKQSSWKDLLDVKIDHPDHALRLNRCIDTPDELWAQKLISFQEEIIKSSPNKSTVPIFLEVGFASTVVPGWESITKNRNIVVCPPRNTPVLTYFKYLKAIGPIDFKITDDWVLIYEKDSKRIDSSWKKLLDLPLGEPDKDLHFGRYQSESDESWAQKLVHFQNEISKRSPSGKTIPIFLKPRDAMVITPGKKHEIDSGSSSSIFGRSPRNLNLEMTGVPALTELKYLSTITGLELKITDDGVFLHEPAKRKN
jgi:hypothetical protein